MNKAILFDFTVDKDNKQINVDRSFLASRELVWAAWTTPEILDQWWAPKPWRNETISMDCRTGGMWHYCMNGPEGERHYCFFKYDDVQSEQNYSGVDGFCDENAILNADMPQMHWSVGFQDKADDTLVNIVIRFDKLENLESIIEMGFKEGFTMGLENLDAYIRSVSNDR